MNSSMAIIFTCLCFIHNVAVTVAYLTSAPTTLSTTYAKQQINQININYYASDATAATDNNIIELLQKKQSVFEINIIDYDGDTRKTNDSVELLQMRQSLIGRAYRRGKKLLTREKEDTTTKTQQKEEPEQLWRVMFHNSEYMPDRVARELTKVFPITRMTAFDICVRARSEGTVTVDICHKKQAEKYVRQLSKRGLVATIQPE